MRRYRVRGARMHREIRPGAFNILNSEFWILAPNIAMMRAHRV